ncbi:hypothetical protein LNQ81_16165 [Myroides sp. M-43]|uniref:hypothetical protein n=1 Tax=Myroides oncorhynchi TaxID=2893756 RepID=UPI001E52B93B|nr:hypothetical protein [Myroides oncorhynchi]MCC9044207.1 hypothetical protein [Myroides oncorhynchi]
MRISRSLFFLLLLMLTSCDFILKDKEETGLGTVVTDGSTEIVVLEDEEDNNGCAYSAGYRWSELESDCVRVFEKGFRLNPVEVVGNDVEENEMENNDVSCFVIFAQDKKKAEIYLPNHKKGIVLDQSKDKRVYTNSGWELSSERMELKNKGEVVFTAAKTIELKVINSDQPIEDENVGE